MACLFEVGSPDVRFADVAVGGIHAILLVPHEWRGTQEKWGGHYALSFGLNEEDGLQSERERMFGKRLLGYY